MAREKLMEKAIEVLSKLPDQKLIEVSDFTEFLIISRREIRKLTEGIQLIFSDSKSFRFLEDEIEHDAGDARRDDYQSEIPYGR